VRFAPQARDAYRTIPSKNVAREIETARFDFSGLINLEGSRPYKYLVSTARRLRHPSRDAELVWRFQLAPGLRSCGTDTSRYRSWD